MDQLPRLGERELICLLLFTCNYVVFVWRGFLFLWVLGMGYFILLLHSLSLPYNYSGRFGPGQFGPHFGQSYLFTGQGPHEIRSELTKSQIALWSELTNGQVAIRSELTKTQMELRSELTNVLIYFRSEFTKAIIISLFFPFFNHILVTSAR